MKSSAHSFIWWPGLDDAIEKLTKDCEPCKVTAAMPPAVARHPWQHPNAPWEGCISTMVNGTISISWC